MGPANTLSEEGSSLRKAVINLLDELEFYGIANTTEAIINGAQDVIFGGLLGTASMCINCKN